MEGKLTILIGEESSRIEVVDSLSGIRFLSITLNPEQLSRLLSREGLVHVDMDIRGLDRIGKKLEQKTVTLELPSYLCGYYNRKNTNKLKEYVDAHLSDGWECRDYFGFKGAFGRNEQGNEVVNALCVRWL